MMTTNLRSVGRRNYDFSVVTLRLARHPDRVASKLSITGVSDKNLYLHMETKMAHLSSDDDNNNKYNDDNDNNIRQRQWR